MNKIESIKIFSVYKMEKKSPENVYRMIPFEELLTILNASNGVKAHIMADDLVIEVNGCNELMVARLIQDAIDMALPWLSYHGIYVNPRNVNVSMTWCVKHLSEKHN